MRNKLLLIVVSILVVVGFWFWPDIKSFYLDFRSQLPNLQKTIQDIKREVVSPPPLRSTQNYEHSQLSRSGVINLTNLQRQQNGLTSLKENYQLNLSAQAKLKDMFAKQYFEHVSPDGRSVSDLAKAAGYDYLVIGENLALGNFKDDQALVEAWMNSPGHRANILNAKYQDIGVAVGQGMFEGHLTWLAVQHFGRPAASCSKPDVALKQQLDADDRQLAALRLELDAKKQQLDDTHPKTGEDYKRQVDSYNSLVEQYNQLMAEIKTLTTQYNFQVSSYNSCLAS